MCPHTIYIYILPCHNEGEVLWKGSCSAFKAEAVATPEVVGDGRTLDSAATDDDFLRFGCSHGRRASSAQLYARSVSQVVVERSCAGDERLKS